MAMTYGDIDTFVHDFENKLIRYWVKKDIFTPYEVDRKFSDQSTYEDSTPAFGFIKVSVSLGNGDYLLGIEPYYDEDPDEDLLFFRLSELRFQINEIDQLDEEDEA